MLRVTGYYFKIARNEYPQNPNGSPEKRQAIEKFGGRWGIRTHDPLIKSQLLYQLS
tara:strand:+ start:114 stop:281 length:168 start_codon:yes stop_codon:yes gene_type:complete